MRRILTFELYLLLSSEHEIETYSKDDQSHNPLSSDNPRNDLSCSYGISDLSLDIVRNERRSIHRHGLEFHTHRLEIQSIHNSLL